MKFSVCRDYYEKECYHSAVKGEKRLRVEEEEEETKRRRRRKEKK